jgi:opacity protein-like surface antigen
MRLTSFTIFAAAYLASSATANAQEQWPAWYVGLHGSLAFVEDADVEDGTTAPATGGEVSFDEGYGYGAAIGYRLPFTMAPWNQLRVEAEVHQERADVDEVASAPGLATAFNDNTTATAYMANLYYDFLTEVGYVKPYVGAGAGWADVELGSESDNMFAWQLMAGLGYVPESFPYTEWTLGYRYFNTADAEFNYGAGPIEMEYSSHGVELGAKFLF